MELTYSVYRYIPTNSGAELSKEVPAEVRDFAAFLVATMGNCHNKRFHYGRNGFIYIILGGEN